MKQILLPVGLALVLLSSVAASAGEADTRSAPQWGLRDAPRLLTPAGLVTVARDEIRCGVTNFKQDLRDLRAGEPEALIKAGFTGARLAGVDGGTIALTRFTWHVITSDPLAPQPRLSEAIPAQLEAAPDRTFRCAVKATARHAITGTNITDAVRGDFKSQALDLVPATLRSIRHVVTRPFAPAPASATDTTVSSS